MTNDQHLDRLEIRRFRGLSELDLDGLGRFNVLIGANGVGKSSVLEAIFLLAGSANLELPIRIQNWRGLVITAFDHLRVLFHDLDVDKPVELVGHSAGLLRSLQVTAPHVEIERNGDSRSIMGGDNGSSQMRGSAAQTASQSSSITRSHPRTLRYDAMVQSPEGDPVSFGGTLHEGGIHFEPPAQPANEKPLAARYLSVGHGYDTQAIGELTVRKREDQLVRFLKVVHPDISKVATSGDTAYVDVGLDQMLPLNMFGSGMVRSACILSYCLLGTDRILLVDELENGLHHAALRPLLKSLLTLARDQEMQVFATTHSAGVLESLLDVLDDDAFTEHRATTLCFALHRDQTGRTRPYRYEHEQFEHCVRHDIEIR